VGAVLTTTTTKTGDSDYGLGSIHIESRRLARHRAHDFRLRLRQPSCPEPPGPPGPLRAAGPRWGTDCHECRAAGGVGAPFRQACSAFGALCAAAGIAGYLTFHLQCSPPPSFTQ
jgi:hypothetical protein